MAVCHIISLILSLLPLSWMVVPIRKLENMHLFILTITSQPPTIARIPSNIDIDIDIDIDIIRGRSNFSSKVSSKNIQKIINSKGKLKPKINMMTKVPSRKQIIISISNENKLRFIESSSDYIANINKVLKNVKFKVMANFI